MENLVTAENVPERSSLVRRFSIRGVAVFIFFATLWFGLWWQLSGEWSVNDQYSYGWFVPFFAIVLFWLRFEDSNFTAGGREFFANRPREAGDSVLVKAERFEDAPKAQFRISNFEFRILAAAAICCLLLLFPIRLFEIGNPDWRPLSWLHAICVVTITLIFLWSTGGVPWLRHFAFPVLFVLVAVPWISPIEMPIIQGLMRFIATVAAETANLLGIPAQVQGNLIQVRTGLIGVNEACSGVRSLQTSLMIGLLFGELRRLSIFRRVVLIAGAIAIAMIANFARAVFLVWLGAEESISAIDRWHDLAGYGIVALVFLGTLILARALAGLLGRGKSYSLSVKSYRETNNKERITNNSAATGYVIPWTFLVVAIVWLVSLEFAAAGWYRAHEQNAVAQARWTVHWPNDASAFREIKIDEGVRSTLRYDEAKQAAWNLVLSGPAGASASEEQPILARCISFFFRWKPGGSSVVRARAHRPDICLPATGWRQISDRGVANYRVNQDLELPFHHLVFADERGGVTAHTFFCLQEDELQPNEPRPDLQVSGGAQPDWSFRGRSRVVLNGVRNRGQQIIEIVLISSHRLNDAEAKTEFAKMLPAIIKPESRK